MQAEQQILEQIRQDCLQLVHRRALISGGVALAPLPLLGVAADVGILMRLLPEINRRFGLSVEDLEAMDVQSRLAIYQLAKTVGNHLIGHTLTKRLALGLLRRVGFRLAAEEGAKWVPLVGQMVAAGLNYAAMRYVARQHVETCFQIATQMHISGVPRVIEGSRASLLALPEH